MSLATAAAATTSTAPLLSQTPLCALRAGLSLAPVQPPPPPPPMRSTFVDRSPLSTRVCNDHAACAFRQRVCTATDVSLRDELWLVQRGTYNMCGERDDKAAAAAAAMTPSASYGERVRWSLWCRWAKKHYGNVTFGPRNFPYPSSRWLSRRFHMKKHRTLKRFRFRRYKLAAVANLPFARMIRVGMLPELKSSKTKAGDTVDAQLSSQLVGAARQSNEGKVKGKRTRPRSKYQV